jgi:ornithine cyclodeaminase/alanine dehydrogenase-like protein (mu-crystallin family)
MVTLVLRDSDVRAVCDIGSLVTFLDQALRKEAKGTGAHVPERLNLAHGSVFLRVMPALLPEAGLLGLKFFHGSMQDGVRYVVAVCSLDTGEILGLIDAAYLTAARTGATSGVATHWLSREDSSCVGVIGSGMEAETNLRAVCSVRPVTRAAVYSRSPQRREAFAARMSESLGIPVRAAADPRAAVAGTDIVVVATNTGPDPVVAYRGAWLEPGQHVVSIGSTTAALREIDTDTILRADTVVFDVTLDQLRNESGDVIAVLDAQAGWRAGVPLDRVITGEVLGRRRPEDITVFKSVGTAAQDLLGASYVLREARRRGVGTEIADITSPKQF